MFRLRLPVRDKDNMDFAIGRRVIAATAQQQKKSKQQDLPPHGERNWHSRCSDSIARAAGVLVALTVLTTLIVLICGSRGLVHGRSVIGSLGPLVRNVLAKRHSTITRWIGPRRRHVGRGDVGRGHIWRRAVVARRWPIVIGGRRAVPAGRRRIAVLRGAVIVSRRRPVRRRG